MRSATADPAQNPLAADLLAYLDAAAWAQGIGWHLDPWQADVLRSTDTRWLLNCCRQSGKSTVAALLALHTAIYRKGSTTLLLSVGQRQSKELFRKVLAGYKYLNKPVAPEAENAMSLALDNGSRVISLPGNESTIRGYSKPDLIVIDEASRVPDDNYVSMLPSISTNPKARVIAMSTPFGISGWWSSAWHNNAEHWNRVTITADDCPRINDMTLMEMRLALGEWSFRQEYYCEFLDDQFSVFHEEDISSLPQQDVTSWRL